MPVLAVCVSHSRRNCIRQVLADALKGSAVRSQGISSRVVTPSPMILAWISVLHIGQG